MKEGPSEPVFRSRFQTTSSGCGKELWSWALRKSPYLKWAGNDQDEIACEHGRLEERQLQVLDAKVLEGLVDLSQWDSLSSIVRLLYTSESFGKKSTEIRYYISSLPSDNPSKILRAIRMHWGIESMHWSLDVTFKEDACRVREKTTALNLSWLRKMSLAFLKAETSLKVSIRRKQLKLWNSPHYFLKVFSMI